MEINFFNEENLGEKDVLPGYIVYQYTNMVNGKRYVGITKQGSISRRFKNGYGYFKRCPHLGDAIQKYGWDSFKKEVIAYGCSKSEAEALEIELIALGNLTDPKNGYNIKSGGHCGTGISEEGRASMIEKNSGLNANKQRPVCVFDCDGNKIGEFPLISFAANHFGIKRGTIINSLRRGNHPCFGMIFKYADEVNGIDKLSQEDLRSYLDRKDMSGANSYNARPVVIFDSVSGKRIREFCTLTEAKKEFNGDIFACLCRRQKTFGDNYTARYLSDVGPVGDLPESERYNPKYALPGNRRSVRQYSTEGVFIAEYISAAEASRRTGIGHKNILLAASGGSKTAGGYIWRFPGSDNPIERPKTSWETRWENGTSNANAVDQIDLKTGEVIATYRSMHVASESTGAQRHQISLICHNPDRYKSSGGYGWRFHKE